MKKLGLKPDQAIGLAAGMMIAIAVSIVLIFSAWSFEESRLSMLTYLAVSGLAGWLLGMLFSPLGEEKSDFTSLRAGLGSFLGGFALAKFEPIFDNVVVGADYTDPQVQLASAVILGAFLQGFALTFAYRRARGLRSPGTPTDTDPSNGQQTAEQAKAAPRA